MIGLLALSVLAVYVAACLYLYRLFGNRGWKILVVIIALGVPFWDLPIGYQNFEKHCATDGGAQKLEKVLPQKTIYFASPTGVRPESLLGKGVELVEYAKIDGSGVVRFSSHDAGVQRSESKTPASATRIRATFNEALSWYLYRQEQVLEDARTGRALARSRSYVWFGGWIQDLTAPMLTPVATCHVSSGEQLLEIALKGSE